MQAPRNMLMVWLSVFSKTEDCHCPKSRGGLHAKRKVDNYSTLRVGAVTISPASVRCVRQSFIIRCVIDVLHLSTLREVYMKQSTPERIRRVLLATHERIELSQTADYEGQGPHMALSPSHLPGKSQPFRPFKKARPPKKFQGAEPQQACLLPARQKGT